MKKFFAIVALAGAALIVQGCVFVPAAHAPTAPPPTENSQEWVEDVNEAKEPSQSVDEQYLELVRELAPGAEIATDEQLLQLAEDSCATAAIFGYEAGLDMIIIELSKTGANEAAMTMTATIYGAAVGFYCPNVLD